ncbi:unnamed protein product [Phaedon cochleariae]|uniref:FAD dependent oxidoreductase domain-containing protein n=1 Tax=Phaedon cochleariae TaxID=80249 RepID=A0A9N9SL32_PHACE|nr:unnamed protein product [Phaedon cochleariae]
MYNIAVVGCGVVGITSALAIQNRVKKCTVTIYAHEVSPNTTTDIAGGLWEPYLLQETPEEKVAEWSKTTYDYLLRLWIQGKAGDAGICLQPVTTATDNENYQRPNWLDSTLGHTMMSEGDLMMLSKRYGTELVGGVTFMSFMWEGATLLPFLQKEFIDNGGNIVMKYIEDIEELSGYDVVVNCTGLGANKLMGDTNVKPIRGQIIKVRAPWIFHSFLIDSEKSGYVLGNKNFVILGGTRQHDDSTKVDDDDKNNILRNCSKLVPSIKSAEIIEHQVGLRPARNKVRLEAEIKRNGDNEVRIVHNYGHGGAGITLSVGCAEEAAKLVEQMLTEKYKSKL